MKSPYRNYKKGMTKYYDGKYHEAIEYFNSVVEFIPCPNIYIYRGHSRLRLGDRDGAIQDWTIAAELTVRKRMN